MLVTKTHSHHYLESNSQVAEKDNNLEIKSLSDILSKLFHNIIH